MNISKNLTIKEIFSLATKNHASNNIEVAQKLYKEVLKINPNYAPAHNNLGVVFKTLGETHKAKDCYEKSIEIDPSYADAYCNLGMIFKELEENQKAIDYYEKAIEINPKHLNAHNNLGVVHQKLTQHQKAKNCYEKAIEINPSNSDSYCNLGTIYGELDENQKAIDYYEKAIEINPKHLNAHNNLGGVYNKLGDYKRAIETYEKVIEIDSNHEITLYNLGVALHSTQQYKNAAEKFKLINFKNSKSFLLSSLYNLDDKSNFFKTLDDQIKQGEINAIIGSLISRSEIKYGVKKQNPFCEDPLKYSLKIDLTEKYNFKDIFVDPVKSFLKQSTFSTTEQSLLIKGLQTAGNLFDTKDYFLDRIKDIIYLEVDKYQNHFKKSKEGFIRSWPKSYNINAWLVSMKSGGKLSPHIHDYGWLSGSIYINVPPKLKTNSGNLVVCINDQEIEAEKDINAKKIMDVVTGNLCLFPSSLYHYTIPFESNEDRIVLAFDVMPN
jgi:tetratricopeptide (TPR) repeat protein